jgi:hypothetical protein
VRECAVLGTGVSDLWLSRHATQLSVCEAVAQGEQAYAEARDEAESHLHRRFVPFPPIESQDTQALHRVRSRLIQERTTMVNQEHRL